MSMRTRVLAFAFVTFASSFVVQAAVSTTVCSQLESGASATARLGCKLFFSTKLSADNHVSCASCHEPEHAFADGRRVGTGIGGKTGTRNTPSLLNAKAATALFWDGRRTSLEELMFDPITNPLEMGLETEDAAIVRVRASTELRNAFAEAFRGERSPTRQQIETALAAFVRSIREVPSAYDRYVEQPASFHLSDAAMRGLALFSGKAGCAECHSVAGAHPVFTDNAFHHSSVGWQAISGRLASLTHQVVSRDLAGRELGNRLTADPDWAALGRFAVTRKPSDIAAFRTPSLRNIAMTAPYMHDGSVPTLSEAVDVEVYYRGLASATPITLSVEDRRDLVAFLETLTDSRRLPGEANAGAAPGK